MPEYHVAIFPTQYLVSRPTGMAATVFAFASVNPFTFRVAGAEIRGGRSGHNHPAGIALPVTKR